MRKGIRIFSAILLGLSFLPFASCSNDSDADDNTSTITTTDGCKVTFDDGFGNVISMVDVKIGTNVDKPTDPQKDGYTFVGWYVDDEEWSFIGYVVTKDLTISAKWNVNSYDICFEPNGGELVTSKHLEYGQSLENITASKIACEFEGWYSDENYITRVETVPAKNCTLYAKYIEDNTVSQGLSYSYKEDEIILTGLGTCTDTKIIIPEGVTSIGNAFGSTNNITSIKIPASVKSIEFAAIRGCNNLKEIIIDENNTVFDSRDNCKAIVNTAKNELVAVCAVSTIPINVTSLGYQCFAHYPSLESIEIPDSVTSIGSCAFAFTSLKKVKIPNGVTTIKTGTFQGCTSLTSIEIPNGVTEIKDLAFAGCHNLTSIEIPSSVTNISNSAFFQCFRLVEVINKSNLRIDTGSKYSDGYIGYYALQIITDAKESKLYAEDNYVLYKESDNDIKLIKYLGEDTDLIVPNSVTSIYDYSFYDCNTLTSVTIPNSVLDIGQNAFYDCSKLENIIIPNSVIQIGKNAFYECSSLTSVAIASGINSIGENAFYNCTNLIQIINKSSINIEKGSTNHGYVGYYALEVISDVSESKIYQMDDYLIFEESDEDIYLVKYSGSDESIIIPKNIKYIYKTAFIGCESIINI